MKLNFFYIKFYENPPSGSRVLCGRMDRRTDVMKLIVAAPTIVLLAVFVFMCFILVSEETGTLTLFNIKLLFFYIRDEKCLLRGTNWVFK
jgi:hypothetical protein